MAAHQVPNALTLGRILLVPVLVVLLLLGTRAADVAGAVVFAVASATDYADGYLARRAGSTSRFGKLMDPFADKLLVVAALVVLAADERVAVWVVVVVAAREVAVTASRTLASRRGTVVAAALWGKAKTTLQLVTVFLLILVEPSPAWLDALVYVMAAVTVLSGLDYARGVRRLLRDGEPAAAARPA